MHCWSSMCMWFLGDDSKLLFSAWTEGKVCVFPFYSSSLPCQPSAWLSMLVNGEKQENRGNVKKMPGTNNSNNEKLSTLTHTPSVEDVSFILHFRANYVLAAYNSHALILLCNLWSFLYIHTHTYVLMLHTFLRIRNFHDKVAKEPNLIKYFGMACELRGRKGFQHTIMRSQKQPFSFACRNRAIKT